MGIKSRELIKDKIKGEIIEILSTVKNIKLKELEDEILLNRSSPQLFLLFTLAIKELEKEGFIEIIRNGHRAPFICHSCQIMLKHKNHSLKV